MFNIKDFIIICDTFKHFLEVIFSFFRVKSPFS